MVALVLIGLFLLWFFTLDFESNRAFQWMTNTLPERATTAAEVKIFEGGQYAVSLSDSVPLWIATDVNHLPINDTVIFTSTQFGKSNQLTISPQQLPLWNDYVRHAQHWSTDCDTLYLVYGTVPNSKEIYSINLCISESSKGQGVIIPNEISDLPFFEFTRSIDEIEKRTNIDFFKDLLDEESESYIEQTHKRLQWLYPESFYLKRITELNNIKDANK